MFPFGLTTIVDLAPRLVLPFAPQAALWLEIVVTLLVSAIATAWAALRRSRARACTHASAGVRTAHVIPLRRAVGPQTS